MPLRAPISSNRRGWIRWSISRISSAPTEVDHYQIRRTVDVYVAPSGEDLSRVYAGCKRSWTKRNCRKTP
jgi:hypothetical protein